MTEKTKLKPCPFCGGEAELFEGYSLSHVYCINCDAQTDGLKNAKRAVELWNSRPIEDDLNEQIGRFKKYSSSLEKEVKTLREALENIKEKAVLKESEASNATYGFAYEIEELAREALKGGEKC